MDLHDEAEQIRMPATRRAGRRRRWFGRPSRPPRALGTVTASRLRIGLAREERPDQLIIRPTARHDSARAIAARSEVMRLDLAVLPEEFSSCGRTPHTSPCLSLLPTQTAISRGESKMNLRDVLRRIWLSRTVTPQEGSGCHSATAHLLKPFRIPSPFHLDVGGGTFDLTEIFGCKLDLCRSEVFFQAM
jgi:hypothetical protein